MNKFTTFTAICLLSLMATASHADEKMSDEGMMEDNMHESMENSDMHTGDMEMEEDMESEGM